MGTAGRRPTCWPLFGQYSQIIGDDLPWQMPAHLAAIHLPASTVAADYAFAYDEIGRLRSATDAEGHVWQYRIANGRRGEIVDPLSGHTVSLFDPNAREVADIDALGHLSTMAYDGLGRVTAKTGPEGIREDTLYDARNNPIRTTRHAKPGSGLADLATLGDLSRDLQRAPDRDRRARRHRHPRHRQRHLPGDRPHRSGGGGRRAGHVLDL